MQSVNDKYHVLYVSFVGINYKLSDIKNYIKLNYLGKKLNLIMSKKTISYGGSNVLYYSIGINLNDNRDNQEIIEYIYNILIEDALEYNYTPRIRVVKEKYSFSFEDVLQNDYKNTDVKNMFIGYSNNHSISKKRDLYANI